MLLEEGRSEDENGGPVEIILQRQNKEKASTKTTEKTAVSSDDEDDVPFSQLLKMQHEQTQETTPKNLRDKKGEIVMGENAIGVRIANVFQDMGMFTGIVDRCTL
jgi:hypothetical protein